MPRNDMLTGKVYLLKPDFDKIEKAQKIIVILKQHQASIFGEDEALTAAFNAVCEPLKTICTAVNKRLNPPKKPNPPAQKSPG